ncbi:MAG: hypothetical protein ABIN55_12015 [Aeromicrobium sp.]
MVRPGRWTFVAAVLPPIVVGLAGITHPQHLTQDASLFWRNLHVVFLPLLPLLALGPWLVARSVDRKLGYAAAALGYVYACFYTALDLLAGVGAGALKHEQASGVRVLFDLAADLGQVGSVAFIVATAVAAGCALSAARVHAIPGSVLVFLGAYGYMQEHVYWPGGVASMFALATGWALLLLAIRRAAAG